jgi:hypothetical protein
MKTRKILTYGMPVLALAYVAALFLTPLPGWAYITIQRWTGNSTEWWTQFQSGVASAPFPSSAYSNVVTASNRWSNASTGKNFNFINYTGLFGPVRMNINKVSFSAAGLPGDPGTTGVSFLSTGRLASATVYLNSDWSWNTSCTLNQANRQADFLTIVLHEMGHAVALDHDSRFTSAVMWPNYTCKQSLTTDDKNGIGALYP